MGILNASSAGLAHALIPASGHADYNAYYYEEAMQNLYNATLENLEEPSSYSERLLRMHHSLHATCVK